jgi:hypothetical protein
MPCFAPLGSVAPFIRCPVQPTLGVLPPLRPVDSPKLKKGPRLANKTIRSNALRVRANQMRVLEGVRLKTADSDRAAVIHTACEAAAPLHWVRNRWQKATSSTHPNGCDQPTVGTREGSCLAQMRARAYESFWAGGTVNKDRDGNGGEKRPPTGKPSVSVHPPITAGPPRLL